MDVFTWEMAAAVVGSIGAICATIYKILHKPVSKDKKPCDEHRSLIMENRQAIAVIETKLEANKEDNKEEHIVIREQIKGLTDLIHELIRKL